MVVQKILPWSFIVVSYFFNLSFELPW